MTENTDTAATAAPADAAAEIAALRAKLAEAEQQVAALRDQSLRAAAETDNVRKRAEREVANSLKYGADRVLGDLLSVCDSLELGLKAAQAPEATAKSIGEGLLLTHKQLHAFFDKHGVKVLDPAGQPFNPELHEAVSMLESAEVAPNHVLSVMQKGYRLHERLLRPAMVVVAKAPAAS
ncbi:MAG TPA: nucleotide exchange factor GrpE [Nevskia sp.]|nr:nucleotide exchange factor GrpE [Nevskia sp.]